MINAKETTRVAVHARSLYGTSSTCTSQKYRSRAIRKLIAFAPESSSLFLIVRLYVSIVCHDLFYGLQYQLSKMVNLRIYRRSTLRIYWDILVDEQLVKLSFHVKPPVGFVYGSIEALAA